MSKESFWFLKIEKLIGILVVIIGGFSLYFTYTSTEALGVFTGLFGFLGSIILLLGLFMIIAKQKN